MITLLIVDDSRPFLEVARSLLARDGLQVVGTASTSAEAVTLAAALHPQVALVDVHLAGESGFDVARQLAANIDTSGVSVVLMSTHSEDELTELIEQSPALGFVAKQRLSGEAVRVALSGGS